MCEDHRTLFSDGPGKETNLKMSNLVYSYMWQTLYVGSLDADFNPLCLLIYRGYKKQNTQTKTLKLSCSFVNSLAVKMSL